MSSIEENPIVADLMALLKKYNCRAIVAGFVINGDTQDHGTVILLSSPGVQTLERARYILIKKRLEQSIAYYTALGVIDNQQAFITPKPDNDEMPH